ncbi:uncharacterized protein [Nicotiana tomentosiformis]|uniref:uncharacterized protein n=1 Tax=Nicotiana tomentosiformis TaxID=4098 RepID=UPI00388C5F06
MDPLKYIFQKPMPTGKLAKWQIFLTEFDIVYVTRTAMKAQALADHLVENPVDNEYESLNTYFPDEEVNLVEEVVQDDSQIWKLYFDGAVNIKGVGIGTILVSPTGQHYPATARLRFFCTNNTAKYEACIMAIILKAVTKKAVVDFVHSNIICRFGIPKTIITDNAANLNSHLVKEILRKMIQGSRQWHEKLPFALLGYRTTVRTSVGATPYLLVNGTEAVIPADIEIPSLRIIVEAGIEDTEWVKSRLEQLNLIAKKRLAAVCFGFSKSTDWMCKNKITSLARESGTFDLITSRNKL